MNILEQIKQHKIKEVNTKKELYSTKLLEQSIYFPTKCVSLVKYVTESFRSGIIAEFKRKSPSKGDINKYANVQEVSMGYMQAGASALSILTDEYFFGAKKEDLTIARKFNYCPILRKDFIIDEYQILEAKSMGADAILLIAKLLTPKQIQNFTKFAHHLTLEVLVEFHNEKEINENNYYDFDLAGINNRDLSTFNVTVENSLKLSELLPKNIVKVAESGINSVQMVKKFKEHGFQGFLIGEYFMMHSNPVTKCSEFIKQLYDEN